MPILSPFQLFMRQALLYPLPAIYGMTPSEILGADDFRDGVFDTNLLESDAAGAWSKTETSGILRLARGSSGGGGASVWLKGGPFDLTGCGITSQVVQDGMGAGYIGVTIPCLFNQADDENGHYLYLADGNIIAGDWNLDLFTMPYDPQIHKYFRMREKNGKTFWEVSENGILFTTFYSQTSIADWTQAAQPGFGLFNWDAGGPNNADFDNFLVARYE